MVDRTCSKCKLLKSTDDFYKQSRNPDGLGRFKDNIVFLEEAIKYLKAHSEE